MDINQLSEQLLKYGLKSIKKTIMGEIHLMVAKEIAYNKDKGINLHDAPVMVSSKNGLLVAQTQISWIFNVSQNLDEIISSIVGFFTLNNDKIDKVGKDISFRRALGLLLEIGFSYFVVDSNNILIYEHMIDKLTDYEVAVSQLNELKDTKYKYKITVDRNTWGLFNNNGDMLVLSKHLSEIVAYLQDLKIT